MQAPLVARLPRLRTSVRSLRRSVGDASGQALREFVLVLPSVFTLVG